MQQASGQIIEPSGKSETALRFIAGLTAGVDLVATLDSVDRIQDVCISVSRIIFRLFVVKIY